ncbi:MAG: MFS transporter [Bacteroidetes bacterium]|nr:MFS transporter [Bacteroidota bacterium]MDA1119458.1 MFS transporter [Bacteroidota bacterium]
MTHQDNPDAVTRIHQVSGKAEGPLRPTNVRWLIVAMLMGFTILGHFNRVSISVAANAKFIGPGLLTAEQMGQVYSTFLLIYTLCMLPGGWVIDHIGPRLAMAGMGLGIGFSVVLTGGLGWLGLPIASLFIPLLFVRGIAGSLSTPLHPGAARSVSLWLPLTSRSTANGLVTAGALIGISLSYPGFGWLMNQFDWSWAFVISGSTMMGFSIFWLLVSTDDAASHPKANATEKQMVVLNSVVPSSSRASVGDFTALFRNRGLLILTFSYAALSYFQYLFFYWIEFYFGKELKLPEDASRHASFIVTMAMAVGMAFGGVLADQLSRRIGLRWGCRSIVIAGMLMSAVFAWFGVAAEDPNHVIWLFSLALGSLGLCEGIFWTSAPALEPKNGGLACAFLNTIGNAGGILAPVCTPWIGAHYGWPTAIGVACCVCAAGAVLWLWIDPLDPKAETISPNWLSILSRSGSNALKK